MPKVSSYPAASTPLTGAESIYLVQGGNSRQTSINSLFNATGTAPFFGIRAFVEFNGTGTPAIRASGNVASITDNGVGDYTINFTTPMPDANYALFGGGRFDTTNANDGHPTVGIRRIAGAKTTTSVRITVINPSTSAGFDCDVVCVVIVR